MPTSPQPNDVLRRMFDDSMTMLDPWMAAWTNATTLATPAVQKDTHREAGGCTCSGREHEHSCGCRGDRCGCSSRDADLVLVARVGERRLVPLVLHNEWRRERPITLGVSAFRPCDPCAEDVAIVVATEPGELVLAPCSRTVVDVIVDLSDRKGEQTPLTRCTTVYGDISTDGCARPVRLAVVVLPRECDAHEIDCCGCGC